MAVTAFSVIRCARMTRTPTATNAPLRLQQQTRLRRLRRCRRLRLEQRVESVEAYFQNGDPTAPLKDTNGNIVVTGRQS